MGSGTVRTSLFAAADDARIPDGVVGKIVEIFSSDIDFHRCAAQRATASTWCTRRWRPTAKPMRTGRVLSAEFVNNGKLHQAMWFQEPGRKGGYYTLDGKSLDTSYLASPMEFSRVTSGFAMRFHPVLRSWRAHLGVDYGAATGTPVRTVGDGVVEFAGGQNGFGNVVIVKHNNTDQTFYAHLSRIDVRLGQSVQPGPAHRRRRRHGLGHRPAPALRVPRQRRAPRSRGDGQAQRSACRCRPQARPEFDRACPFHARPAGRRLHRSPGQRRLIARGSASERP